MLALLLTTVLPMLMPAVAPAIGDAIRTGVAAVTKTAGATPKTVAEAIDLMKAETEQMLARTGIDKGDGPSYLWVEAVRKLMRPAAAVATLGAYIMTNVYGYGRPEDALQCAQLASVVFSYLFGERTLLYARRK